MSRAPRVQTQQFMSNSNGSDSGVLRFLLWAGLLVVFVSSCASKHTQETSQNVATVQSQPTTIPPRPRTGDDKLSQAASQGSVPLEGEDWTDMFDGQTL